MIWNRKQRHEDDCPVCRALKSGSVEEAAKAMGLPKGLPPGSVIVTQWSDTGEIVVESPSPSAEKKRRPAGLDRKKRDRQKQRNKPCWCGSGRRAKRCCAA